MTGLFFNVGLCQDATHCDGQVVDGPSRQFDLRVAKWLAITFRQADGPDGGLLVDQRADESPAERPPQVPTATGLEPARRTLAVVPPAKRGPRDAVTLAPAFRRDARAPVVVIADERARDDAPPLAVAVAAPRDVSVFRAAEAGPVPHAGAAPPAPRRVPEAGSAPPGAVTRLAPAEAGPAVPTSLARAAPRAVPPLATALTETTARGPEARTIDEPIGALPVEPGRVQDESAPITVTRSPRRASTKSKRRPSTCRG